MRRVRTTKSLAKRIDLQYFTRAHPLRRWRLWLSLALPVVCLGVFFAVRAQGGPKVYSSGPLSSAHAALSKQCAVCHAPRGGEFRLHVDDRACLGCHDAPAHHQTKVQFTPACASCHLEHQGAHKLAEVDSTSCARCHANLITKAGTPRYAANITRFDDGHPEFAWLRNATADPGGVKLNHYAHLQPGLQGPQGNVQMQCEDCHLTSVGQPSWPYAKAPQAMPAANADPAATPGLPTFRDTDSRRTMQPIRYAQQCEGCHERDLRFDPRPPLGELSVPHDKPKVVHRYLVQQFASYIAAHPSAVHEVAPPDRYLPGDPKPSALAARNSAEWVDQHVAQSERLLWNKGCKLCHTLRFTEGEALPEVQASKMQPRGFAHAEFSHDSHRAVDCSSCHARARNTKLTSDVSLPGIATCRACHQDKGPAQQAADGRCSACHSYHDWTQEQPTHGTFTIEQLRGKAKVIPDAAQPGGNSN